MGDMTGFSGPAKDVAAIRALHDCGGDAVSRRAAEAWGALWAWDAGWDVMGTRVEGRGAIVGLWTQAMAGFALSPVSMRKSHRVRPAGRRAVAPAAARMADGWRDAVLVGFFSHVAAIAVSGDRAGGQVWTHELLAGDEAGCRPPGRYDELPVKRAGARLPPLELGGRP